MFFKMSGIFRGNPGAKLLGARLDVCKEHERI